MDKDEVGKKYTIFSQEEIQLLKSFYDRRLPDEKKRVDSTGRSKCPSTTCCATQRQEYEQT